MERLQKVLAKAGIASRRKAEEIISEGRVKVNGKRVTEMGCKVAANDKIEVDGVPIEQEQLVYFLFYKPRGVISAVTDDKERKVVTDFFPSVSERIYPIGRLDYDTSGLLLLTNDGAFSQMLSHPKHELNKTYVAKVKGTIYPKDLAPFSKGIRIDGRKTAPAQYRILSADRKSETSVVEVTIHEGRNHQVKKMFEAIGFPVSKLKRERYGQLDLTGLRPGQYRVLSKHEINELKQLAK